MSHKRGFVYLCSATNYSEFITQIYKATRVRHTIPIIGKAEHRYTKQRLQNIKYQL
jgi:hypothetical protein